MITSANLSKKSQPKSILDMTPFELSQIDKYQDTNRGFIDNDEDSFFTIDAYLKAQETLNDKCLTGACLLSNTLKEAV